LSQLQTANHYLLIAWRSRPQQTIFWWRYQRQSHERCDAYICSLAQLHQY